MTGRCVALAVGEDHPRYGQSWCGRVVYRYESRDPESAVGWGDVEDGDEVAERPDGSAVLLRMKAREFVYTSATHALLAHADGPGSVAVCPACADAMAAALARGRP
jgi:hypothetical protein